MREGKLSSDELSKLIISKTSLKNAEVIQSAGIAEDCSAIKSDKILLLTTDPITAAGANAGKLCIYVSANDIAVSGGRPICCLLTVIAPVTASSEDIAAFMNEASDTAAAEGIDIIGGHTEFSSAVNKMIVSCTMIGTAKKVIKTTGANAGDSIIMTKTAAVEGTAVMAGDYGDTLLAKGLTAKELEEAKGYIDSISVYPEASAALASKGVVNSMHDITEGGIYGAVAELAEACGLGATVYADRIPVSPVTAKICDILDVSPMRVIGSGSMLIVTPDPDNIIRAVKKIGVECTVIGTMRTKKEVRAIGEGINEKLAVAPDQLLRINKNLRSSK